MTDTSRNVTQEFREWYLASKVLDRGTLPETEHSPSEIPPPIDILAFKLGNQTQASLNVDAQGKVVQVMLEGAVDPQRLFQGPVTSDDSPSALGTQRAVTAPMHYRIVADHHPGSEPGAVAVPVISALDVARGPLGVAARIGGTIWPKGNYTESQYNGLVESVLQRAVERGVLQLPPAKPTVG